MWMQRLAEPESDEESYVDAESETIRVRWMQSQRLGARVVRCGCRD